MNRGPVVDMSMKGEDVLAALFEIRPQIQVNGLGLQDEVELIQGQGAHVYPGDVIHQGTGGAVNRAMSRIVSGSREDAVSSFLELKRYMISRPSDGMLDEQLQKTMIMAETFALRAAEYLNYRAQLEIMNHSQAAPGNEEVNHG